VVWAVNNDIFTTSVKGVAQVSHSPAVPCRVAINTPTHLV
jgi:hypothetical protein